MEINPNRHVDPALPVGAPFKARPSAPAKSETSFEQSAGLDSALRSTPDTRSELVSRAEDLVSSSAYPPPEVIKRIANLLASNLAEDN